MPGFQAPGQHRGPPAGHAQGRGGHVGGDQAPHVAVPQERAQRAGQVLPGAGRQAGRIRQDRRRDIARRDHGGIAVRGIAGQEPGGPRRVRPDGHRRQVPLRAQVFREFADEGGCRVPRGFRRLGREDPEPAQVVQQRAQARGLSRPLAPGGVARGQEPARLLPGQAAGRQPFPLQPPADVRHQLQLRHRRQRREPLLQQPGPEPGSVLLQRPRHERVADPALRLPHDDDPVHVRNYAARQQPQPPRENPALTMVTRRNGEVAIRNIQKLCRHGDGRVPCGAPVLVP